MRLRVLGLAVLWSCALAVTACADFVSGEVIVRFKPGVVGMGIQTFSAAPNKARIKVASVKTLAERAGVTAFSKVFQQSLRDRPELIGLGDYYKLIFPKDKNVPAVVEDFKKDPNVVFVQPNYIYRAFKTTPNDTYYSSQWALPKIQADDAWDITTGTTETIVAVLDTGVNYNHEDLSGKVILGRDLVNSDNDPLDDQGHGTTVAGVIGAITNNAKGVAGVSWHTRILAVKVLYPTGGGAEASGDADKIADGIRYAASNAHILNMSFGGDFGVFDELISGEITSAYNAGKILIAAAGNDGLEREMYPAAYPVVIAVAATDQNDLRSVWPSAGKSSNYGAFVDVSAPGTAIATTNMSGGYSEASGTSFASPVVAGVAALVKGRYPTLSNAEIRSLIVNNTDSIDVLNPAYAGKLGSGRVNAYKALGALVAKITSPEAGAYITGSVAIKGTATGQSFSRYRLGVRATGTFESLAASTSSIDGGTLGIWDTTGKNGNYTLVLSVEGTVAATQETTTSVVVDNLSPSARITSPAPNATAEGRIVILGTASDANISSYLLEYGSGSNPASFVTISTHSASVESGILGSWETTGLSGVYTLRLRVNDRAGHSSSESVTINIGSVSTAVKSAASVISGPNPFNPSRDTFYFSYNLSSNFDATLYVLDLTGNLVWQKSYSAGENGGKAGANTPSWDGRDLSGGVINNGVYVYQVVSDRKVVGRGKMMVLR